MLSSGLSCSPMFQFTLPRGERQARSRVLTEVVCFNSRSRGGSDKTQKLLGTGLIVSIHAPAGGATLHLAQDFDALPFQFTLPRGERLLISAILSIRDLFQFTLPRGERQGRNLLITQFF